MARPSDRASLPEGLDATDLVVGVIAARWNADIVERLADGARRAVAAVGGRVVEMSAPGAFELPFAARSLAVSAGVEAIVVLGAVIRGETTHYEIVSEGCAAGVMRVQLDTGIPIGFGVLTVENRPQALARSGGGGEHNVGEEATLAAIEMALAARALADAAAASPTDRPAIAADAVDD